MAFRRKKAISSALQLVALFSIVEFGACVDFAGLKSSISSGKALSCYVCNSKIEPCSSPQNDVRKTDCKAAYLEKVYGDDANYAGPLKSWPRALSELSAASPTGKCGWELGGFPSLYKLDSTPPESANGLRTSSFENVKNSENDFMAEGFRSCRKMTVTAIEQLNGEKRREITTEEPRIIRTCSFSAAKQAKDGFDEKGCRTFNYKTATVEVCYCDTDNCNGSSYLRVSHWMSLLSLGVFLAELLRK